VVARPVTVEHFERHGWSGDGPSATTTIDVPGSADAPIERTARARSSGQSVAVKTPWRGRGRDVKQRRHVLAGPVADSAGVGQIAASPAQGEVDARIDDLPTGQFDLSGAGRPRASRGRPSP
jgi:hypothetical protein